MKYIPITLYWQIVKLEGNSKISSTNKFLNSYQECQQSFLKKTSALENTNILVFKANTSDVAVGNLSISPLDMTWGLDILFCPF